MFGWINDCTEKLVLTKFGIEQWHAIKAKAGCEVADGGFIRHEYYPDESTVQLVVAASEILGLTVDQVLEAFGTYFMEFVRAEGYENLLQCQGNTLSSWLSNMNALHDHLESSLPRGMVKPVFWCETPDCSRNHHDKDDNNKDDESNNDDAYMILHYYSKRGNLLVPLVIGVVKEVARYHFDVVIEMILLQKQAVDGATHTSWKVKAVDPTESWKITVRESNLLPSFVSSDIPLQCPFTGLKLSPKESPQKNIQTDDQVSSSTSPSKCPHAMQAQQTAAPSSSSPKRMKEPCINSRQMKQIFPYHIVVNKSFHIIQVGMSLSPLLMTQDDYLLGQNLRDILHISRPVLGHWEWKSLRKLEDQTFFVDPLGDKLSHIKFKANIIKLSDDSADNDNDKDDDNNNFQVMLVLSPDVKNVSELRKMNLTMSDLPLHSFQRDAVFLGEHIVSEVKSAHKLDQFSKKLKHEQNLSRALLHTLLPPHVADEMRTGKAIQPELHENVTIFFSDIVGFTSICDEIFPWDCIDLLNRLYCVMDFLAAKFNIYKIETIGDSYLCASGLLAEDPKHADNIANFAIAVLHCLPLVRNPVTGQPLQLRIGIHTGPVMTGVVGMSTPHYCVFGDAVNTASRHESTGVAGKIQCSSITYGLLEHFRETKEFHIVPRGLIEMKGKGLMATYFLEGATKDNKAVNEAALHELFIEVDQMISVRRFTNKRYFKRYGRRNSETYLGSFGGSMTEDDFSESNEGSDEDEDDGVVREEEEEDDSMDEQRRHAELEVFDQ